MHHLLLWGQREQVFPFAEHLLSQGRKPDLYRNLIRAQQDSGRWSTRETLVFQVHPGWAYAEQMRLNTWRVCRLRKAWERHWLAFGVMKDQRLRKTLAVMKDKPRIWSSKAEKQLQPAWRWTDIQKHPAAHRRELTLPGRSRLREGLKKTSEQY